ncbi:MAG TPA: histidine triad nucleotide-binding protein [Smithellaceae bacterium]|jgi:histidine triad (HIT) family protein|nr:histidine triad nucleotide-binding protein [Syntrophaceae bacterium]NMC90046.1 histidine triad nucleotide-binding protein [Smithella sp.]OQC74170.1 MAG: HIT-like protein [Deltaproteobacteria bacterium ADurb.Bin002]HNV57092.1 histidine triad nucleotide-binding protein [Smithellaceae bacterium]MBP8666348.1 histidine triad nucleotide-binding protein [Syntrophaceae bacterium]
MAECIFCKIIKGDIPSKKVYEDDAVLAFDDISPMAPVHVIIIPKKHIATLLDVDTNADIMGRWMAAAQQVAKMKQVADSGFRLAINCNADGGQVVFHLHMHLLGGRKLEDPLG